MREQIMDRSRIQLGKEKGCTDLFLGILNGYYPVPRYSRLACLASSWIMLVAM
jgi:hypothetical protein